MTLFDDLAVSQEDKGATTSLCGEYRFTLSRVWNTARPKCLFVMLNPSTADGLTDDPTIRRCRSYAKSWECGGIEVVNLFAYRATDPKDLIAALKSGKNVVGFQNDEAIVKAVSACFVTGGPIVLAWGANASKPLLRPRKQLVLKLLQNAKPSYLSLSKDGEPNHPLMLRADLRPIPFPI